MAFLEQAFSQVFGDNLTPKFSERIFSGSLGQESPFPTFRKESWVKLSTSLLMFSPRIPSEVFVKNPFQKFSARIHSRVSLRLWDLSGAGIGPSTRALGYFASGWGAPLPSLLLCPHFGALVREPSPLGGVGCIITFSVVSIPAAKAQELRLSKREDARTSMQLSLTSTARAGIPPPSVSRRATAPSEFPRRRGLCPSGGAFSPAGPVSFFG